MPDADFSTAQLGAAPARVASVAPADTLSPADWYQELFLAVQSQRGFPDSKTFVDCAPRAEPRVILDAHRTTRARPQFDLKAFVLDHFDLPTAPESHYASKPGQSLRDHIDALWPVLTRTPKEHPTQSTLLPVPNPYVVPGGRFCELYFWDSNFTLKDL